MKIDVEKIFAKRLWLPGWGEIALSALQLALISGLLLIPLFRPGAEAFNSVSQLNGSGFLGRWLHSFHSYCGDIILFAVFIHTIEYLAKKTYRSYIFKPWLYVILLGIISLLVVFSGFVSIGSKESLSAVGIVRGILGLLGLAGQGLMRFLLRTTSSGDALRTMYLHHIATFSVLAIVLTYMHIRRLKSDRYAFYYTLVLILLLSLALPARLGMPAETPALVVKGPWYFIGLQEQLAWMPAWLAGVFLPAAVVVLLLLLPILHKKEKILLYGLSVFILFYLAESLIGWLLRGDGWQLLLR